MRSLLVICCCLAFKGSRQDILHFWLPYLFANMYGEQKIIENMDRESLGNLEHQLSKKLIK